MGHGVKHRLAVLTAHIAPVPFAPVPGDSILAEFTLAPFEPWTGGSGYYGTVSSTATFFTLGGNSVTSIVGEPLPFTLRRDRHLLGLRFQVGPRGPWPHLCPTLSAPGWRC